PNHPAMQSRQDRVTQVALFLGQDKDHVIAKPLTLQTNMSSIGNSVDDLAIIAGLMGGLNRFLQIHTLSPTIMLRTSAGVAFLPIRIKVATHWATVTVGSSW